MAASFELSVLSPRPSTPYSEVISSPSSPVPSEGDESPHFKYQLVTMPADCICLDKILRIWKNYAHDRMASIRSRLAEAPADELLRRQLSEDRTTVDSYVDLINRVQLHLHRGDAAPSNTYVHAIVDRREILQAVGLAIKDETTLKVHLLITAPWNLKLNSSNEEEVLPLVIKGGGTAVIRSFCDLAQEQKLSRLSLKPLDGSLTFYRDHLKMDYDEDSGVFYYVLPETDV